MCGLRLLLIVFVCLGVSAQAQTLPQSVQECLTAVRAYPNQQLKAARDAGKKPDYREITKAKTDLARQYAAQFRAEELSGKDLLLLAQLYQEAEQFDLAEETILKSLVSPSLSQSEKADAFVAGVNIAVSKDPTAEKLKQAEAYVAALDAMGNEVCKQQIRAHARLGGYYSYADIDALNLLHHEKILALLKMLKPEDKKEFSFLPANSYSSIALVHANRGDTTKAIAVLQQGKAELTDPQQSKYLEDAIQRYSLIGNVGASLQGDYWLNTPAETKQLELPGKVTLIQFTAHWCVPCKKSYPAMMKYHNQYAKAGLRVVFSTELYGFFEKQQDLKPEAEMAANRGYYLEHYKIPFPVAVQKSPERKPNEPPAAQLNGTQYRVGGIPQIVLLDRAGVVRLVMVGWDPANEERTTRLIETLLNEAPKTAQK